MKAIAFSLFGSEPKYCVGAIKNIHLARIFYPGWTCVFFVDNTVPLPVIEQIKKLGGVVHDREQPKLCGYFWRFMVNDLEGVERFLIRDTDSRINQREKLAVDEWCASGKSFHVIRDHPHHDTPMMGGMWGATKNAIPSVSALLHKWTGAKEGYFADQDFLRNIVWPIAQKKGVFQHDSCTRSKYPGSRPFPSTLTYDNLRFVGEVFDEHDNPREYDWELWINHIETQ